MAYTTDQIRLAAAAVALDPQALERLLAALPQEPQPSITARFDIVHVLWYAGALIIIGAMSLFATLAFASLGGTALLITALCYAVFFAIAGDRLWRRGLHIPGGLLVTVAVCMAPMAVFGLQDALGWWSYGDPGTYKDFYIWIKRSWLPMEIVTLVAGGVALSFYRFPFIVFVMAFVLWFMSMDLTPWILGRDEFTWDERKLVSMWFGLGVIAVAWIVDARSRHPGFAFWLHLFGLLAFWGGMSSMDSDSEIGKAVYCLINIGLVLLSLFLMRRAYAVFGVLGIAAYLGHLADEVFEDSLLFPFALSLIGLSIIGLGLWLHKHRKAMSAWLDATLPAALQAVRPRHARHARSFS